MKYYEYAECDVRWMATRVTNSKRRKHSKSQQSSDLDRWPIRNKCRNRSIIPQRYSSGSESRLINAARKDACL